MFRYILWYLSIELFGFVVVLSVYNRTKFREVLHAIKIAGFAVLTILIYNISFITRARWQNIGVVLFSLLLFLVIFQIVFLKRFSKKELQQLVQEYFKTVLVGLVTFILLTIMRGFNPELISTEKPMDLSFITSFVRQSYIPFENPWLAGFLLNYYYMGQFFGAIIVYFTKISPWVGYNLLINLIAVFAFQVVYEFFQIFIKKKNVLRNLFFSALVIFGGNLSYIFYIFVPWLQKLTKGVVTGKSSFYYPDATRIIPHTINEFPSYSILLGDLHGHYIVLPFIIAIISFLYMFFTYIIKQKDYKLTLIDIILFAGLASFILTSNSWDVITLSVLGLVILVFIFFRNNFNVALKYLRQIFFEGFKIVLITLSFVFLFLLIFRTPSSGVGFALNCDCKYYPLLWGHIVILILVLLIIYEYVKKHIYQYDFKYIFGIALIIAGLLLIFGVQFVYIKDVFSKLNPPYYRTNTVFKLYYSAWLFLTIGILGLIGDLLLYIKDRFIRSKIYTILGLIGMGMLGYFVVGAYQRFGLHDIKRIKDVWSESYLDGLQKSTAWFSKEEQTRVRMYYKQKYNEHLFIEPINYVSYSQTDKFCIFSGSKCFLGWPFHNVQWHNGDEFKGYIYLGKDLCLDCLVSDKIGNRVDFINSVYNEELSVCTLKNKFNNQIRYVDMTKIHVLIYKKDNVVSSPIDTLNSMLSEYGDQLVLNNRMTRIGYFYDLTCK